MPPKIDEYSRAGVPVEQLFNDKQLGAASAFVWKEQGRHFLITVLGNDSLDQLAFFQVARNDGIVVRFQFLEGVLHLGASLQSLNQSVKQCSEHTRNTVFRKSKK